MPQITYASLVFSGFNSKRYYSFLPPPISNVRYPKSNHSFVDGNFEFNEFNDEYISSFSTVPRCIGSPLEWVVVFGVSNCNQDIIQYINTVTGQYKFYNSYNNLCYRGICDTSR